MLGPTAHDLAGEWRITTDNASWKCSYVSKTEVDCEGRKVTLNGQTVTWEEDGSTGTIIQHGSNYDTINWDDGTSAWKKQGMYDNINTFAFFSSLS